MFWFKVESWERGSDFWAFLDGYGGSDMLIVIVITGIQEDGKKPAVPDLGQGT
jgi:hypothetical protein